MAALVWPLSNLRKLYVYLFEFFLLQTSLVQLAPLPIAVNSETERKE